MLGGLRRGGLRDRKGGWTRGGGGGGIALPIAGGLSRGGLGVRDFGIGGGGTDVEDVGAVVEGVMTCSGTVTVGGAGMKPLTTSEGELFS